jgi:peptidyl-prolyl cis-trans isomerase C
MKKKFVSLLIAGTALVAGCDQANNGSTTNSATITTAPVVDKADAVAVVNGQYISKAALADLEKEVSVRSHGQTFPKEKLIEELIQRQLLLQDALQKQLDKSPEVSAQLENIKSTLLTQADLQSFLKANPVTDAELKAEYDSKVGGSNATEYKASHILVKTEDEAKKLIAELDKGAKFADLANKHSLDAKDSQNGGELGWFSAGQMVEPFSAAVAKLEKGKYSKEPVKTQFGYHIILREDSRAQTPPPFDAVKEQLKPFLERKKVQTMVEAMRKQAKVEILVPLVDEKPKVDEKSATSEPQATEKPATSESAATIAEPVAKEATKESEKPVTTEEAGKEQVPAIDDTKVKAEEAAKSTVRHQDTIAAPSKLDQKTAKGDKK